MIRVTPNVLIGLSTLILLAGCNTPSNQSAKTALVQPSKSPSPHDPNNQLVFESSSFCIAYHCKFDRQWALKTGETNFSYNTTLSETSTDVQVRDGQLSGLGLTFPSGHSLTDDDYRAINLLLNTADTSRDHSAAMRFVRKNIANVVCDECSVPTDAPHTLDGNFRVAAGTSGGPVVSLQRIGSAKTETKNLEQTSQDLSIVRGDYSAATHRSPTAEAKLRACNREVAKRSLAYGSEIALRSERGNSTIYRFKTRGWSALAPVANALASTLADSDACIRQSARRITFYSPSGNRLGVADPAQGIVWGAK